MNVSLLQWQDWVDRRVKSREFSSASEVVRHCIRVANQVERIAGPRGASFVSREQLEKILEDSFSDKGGPMTPARKRAIAKSAGLEQ